MKIGIFGGTFNPPHLGHLKAAQAAMESLGIQRLFVIPTSIPPHKKLPGGTPAPEDRYRMAQLLFAGDTRILVLDREISRSGPSYTVDTVLTIKRRYPDAEIYLFMGTDMFLSLETWHRAEELIRMITPTVFARAAGQRSAILDYASRLQEKYGVTPCLVDYDLVETSSTSLREALADRQGVEFVGDVVYREIVRRGHYGVRRNLPWLREQAYAMLKPKRVLHVQGTEAEAVRLAVCWGVPEDLAREAAILHDITKNLDQKLQLQICEKYGTILDHLTKESKKLLHAKTGAEIARAEFSVCDAVYEAIAYHTTGRAGMTCLDKVLYIADFIEPNRDFPEVHALRELAYTDLDRAVLYGLELTLAELEARKETPHPDTRAAIQWICAEIEG